MTTNDDDNLFNAVVDIGFGKNIISFLLAHETLALGCVNKQCAKVVRMQKVKGNIKAGWFKKANNHITIRYNKIIIPIKFPVEKIVLIKIKDTSKMGYKIIFCHKSNENLQKCSLGDDCNTKWCIKGHPPYPIEVIMTMDYIDLKNFYDICKNFNKVNKN
jgi:hypothetical protein